jgi:hypothetical protein
VVERGLCRVCGLEVERLRGLSLVVGVERT